MEETLMRSQRREAPNAVFDFRAIWEQQITKVLYPLKESGAIVDRFVSVHSSYLDTEVLQLIKPLRWHFEKNPESAQGQQIKSGLALIQNEHRSSGKNYNFIVVLRLDLLFKMEITKWPLNLNMLNVPFRSINDTPNYCTCLVADTILAFPPNFIDRVIRYCGETDTSCHGLGASFSDVSIMFDGQCYNSNTGVEADEYSTSRNPLYILYGRYYEYGDAPIPHNPGSIVGSFGD